MGSRPTWRSWTPGWCGAIRSCGPRRSCWLAVDSVNASLRRRVSSHPQLNARPLMAERSPSITCDDVPLDEARRMSRPPPMQPTLDDRLRHRRQSRSVKAVRVPLDPAVTPPRMKRSAMTSVIVLGCIALFGCTSSKSGMAPPAETATPSLVADPAPTGPPPEYVTPENYWVREKIILTSAPEPSAPAPQKSSGKKAKKHRQTGTPPSSPR
jgi:hypothetical protein